MLRGPGARALMEHGYGPLGNPSPVAKFLERLSDKRRLEDKNTHQGRRAFVSVPIARELSDSYRRPRHL
jgi:hypothetical protein